MPTPSTYTKRIHKVLADEVVVGDWLLYPPFGWCPVKKVSVEGDGQIRIVLNAAHGEIIFVVPPKEKLSYDERQ